MLRSDNPAKSYRSLHISDKWVGGFDRLWFICHPNAFPIRPELF